MVNTVSLKELRPELPKVIKRIDGRLDRYVVTRRGKPVVVMLSVDDYVDDYVDVYVNVYVIVYVIVYVYESSTPTTNHD